MAGTTSHTYHGAGCSRQTSTIRKGRALSTPLALLKTMRPKQWTKNLIVFAPLIFGGRLSDARAVATSVLAFVIFCLISGSVYLLNDLKDLERDRAHAKKRARPLAAGELKPSVAMIALGVLAPVALGSAFALSVRFGLVTLGYLALQVAYTLVLKNQVILDVMAISAGFVLRAAAGAAAVDVSASPWLYMCAALLALFLGFGKRRHELVELEAKASDHRAVLADYSPQFIDAMLSTVTAATIIAYSMYTFISATAEQAHNLMFTVPFVVYGLFRYQFLIYKRNLGGSPEEILLTDAPLIATIVLWLVAVAGAMYIA